MINDIITGLYSRFVSDGVLANALAASVISPNTPAVYSALPVPQTAQLPYVVISGPVSVTPDDTFDAEYNDVLIDIHCYDAKPDGGGGSVAGVNTIADRIWTLTHRQPLALNGNPRNLILRVEGHRMYDDEGAVGRVITLRAHMG